MGLLQSKNKKIEKYKSSKALTLTTVIGNFIEFYDFSVYAFLAPIIGPLFFPSTSAENSLIMVYQVFAISFLARLLGAYYFGKKGDKTSRNKALSSSIAFMGLSTFCIGLIPTYEQIGWAAPFLLGLLRFLQGFSAGAEYNGAAIYLLENSEKSKRGYVSCIVTISAVAGGIFGLLVGFIFTKYNPSQETWRFLFMLGGVLSFLGYYLRKKFYYQEKPGPSSGKEFSLKKNLPSILCVIGLTAAGGHLYYLIFFLNSLATLHFEVGKLDMMQYMIIGLSFLVLMEYFVGKLSLKISPIKIIKKSIVIAFFLVGPAYLFLETSLVLLWILGAIVFILFEAFIGALPHALTYELFPKQYRYRAVALSFNLGMFLFGGSTPFLSFQLIKLTGHRGSPLLLSLLCLFLGYLSIKKIQKISENSSVT